MGLNAAMSISVVGGNPMLMPGKPDRAWLVTRWLPLRLRNGNESPPIAHSERACRLPGTPARWLRGSL
jgi:hypothetical protein